MARRVGCPSFFEELGSAARRGGFRADFHTRPSSEHWPESCIADVHLPDFDERIRRIYGTRNPYIGVASSIEWIPDESRLWGEILVPLCPSDPGHRFLFTPSVDLFEVCKIEQVHCHSGAVPTCHIHFSCDIGDYPASVSWLFDKLGVWLGELNGFSRETCGASL